MKNILVLAAMLVLVSCTSYDKWSIEDVSQADAEKYHLDKTFFQKTARVQGILIATSDKVSDTAIKETAYLFDILMQNTRADIAQRIREKSLLCILVAHDEVTSDVPHFATKKKGKDLDFYNWRQRGFLSRRKKVPIVLFSEESVLQFKGGASSESILVHEFGHVVHLLGFNKKLNEELDQAFKKSMSEKLWQDGLAAYRFPIKSIEPVSLVQALKNSLPYIPETLLVQCITGGDVTVNGEKCDLSTKVHKKDKVYIHFGGPRNCYATKNKAEYFAEGYQTWFDTNRTMDHDHNHIYTRDQLKKYDPWLAALCKNSLMESDWRFTSPLERAGQGHLKDFDPAKSPEYKVKDHLRKAGHDYFEKLWKPYWKRLAQKYSVELDDFSVSMWHKSLSGPY